MLRRFICLFNLTPLAVAILLVLTFTFQQSEAQPALNFWSSNGPNVQIGSIVVDPNSPNIIYAAGEAGVFKSINNGASWSVSNQGLAGSFVTSLAVAPSDPNILFAVTAGGVFKTTDGGANWSRTNPPLNTIGLVAIAPSNPNVVYSATYSNLLVTTNGGDTWNTRPFPNHMVNLVVVDPQNPSMIYASFNDGYDSFFSGQYKSVDGGNTWTNLVVDAGRGVDTYSLRIDTGNTNIIYVATGYGIYKSTDAGVSWARRGSPGGNPENTETIALAIDPLNPGTLFAGAYGVSTGYAVYKSQDDGATWSLFNNGLPTNLEVGQLALDRSGRFLHAATTAGVFSVRVREDAANVTVSGRVNAPDGRGLRNATVSLTDSLGTRRTVTTSSFGFYAFDNVPTGDSYLVGVSSRLYRFASRNLVVNDNLTNLDFVGLD